MDDLDADDHVAAIREMLGFAVYRCPDGTIDYEALLAALTIHGPRLTDDQAVEYLIRASGKTQDEIFATFRENYI
jgi:hypothetical protein